MPFSGTNNNNNNHYIPVKWLEITEDEWICRREEIAVEHRH
jgi:hypothetical protein